MCPQAESSCSGQISFGGRNKQAKGDNSAQEAAFDQRPSPNRRQLKQAPLQYPWEINHSACELALASKKHIVVYLSLVLKQNGNRPAAMPLDWGEKSEFNKRLNAINVRSNSRLRAHGRFPAPAFPAKRYMSQLIISQTWPCAGAVSESVPRKPGSQVGRPTRHSFDQLRHLSSQRQKRQGPQNSARAKRPPK